MRAQVLSNVNLIRKTGPEFKSKSSISATGYITYTIPATASVGDYIILVCNNGTSMTTPSNPSLSGWVTLYSPGTSGSTYSDSVTAFIKICRAEDIGSSVVIYAAGYQIEGTLYTFSNPNGSFITTKAYESYDLLYSFLYYSKNQRAAASTTTVSSINLPAGSSYGSKYTRISYCTVNPNSTYGYISWSGSGTSTQVNDGYYWRGFLSVYEQDSLNLSGNFISTAGGAMVWQSFYII